MANWLQYVWWGVCDYVNDVRHDRDLERRRNATDPNNVNNWYAYNAWRRDFFFKEGNVWHYIRQRLVKRRLDQKLKGRYNEKKQGKMVSTNRKTTVRRSSRNEKW